MRAAVGKINNQADGHPPERGQLCARVQRNDHPAADDNA